MYHTKVGDAPTGYPDTTPTTAAAEAAITVLFANVK